nr:unnamed protein product [Callosobruchus chinensis]
MTPDPTPAECSVPWLNEVLVLFTVGLQLCQQLKDKSVLKILTLLEAVSQQQRLRARLSLVLPNMLADRRKEELVDTIVQINLNN